MGGLSTIQDHLELFTYTGSYMTSQNYIGLYMTMQNYTGLCKNTIKNCAALYRIQDYIDTAL